MVEETFELGDIVYEKRLGWSGVPLKVLEFRTVRDANGGKVPTALLRDMMFQSPWTGLYSEEHQCYTVEKSLRNLTKEPNSAIRNSSNT